jgi:hypothetical protein
MCLWSFTANLVVAIALQLRGLLFSLNGFRFLVVTPTGKQVMAAVAVNLSVPGRRFVSSIRTRRVAAANG